MGGGRADRRVAAASRGGASRDRTGRRRGARHDRSGRRARNGAPARAGHEPGLDPARRRRRPLRVPHASRRPLRADGVVRSLPGGAQRVRAVGRTARRPADQGGDLAGIEERVTVATAGALETTRTHVGHHRHRARDRVARGQRPQLPRPGAARAGRVAHQHRLVAALRRDVRGAGHGNLGVVAAQPEQRVRRRRPVRQRRRGRPVRLVLLAGSRARVPGGDVRGARGAGPGVGRRLHGRDALGHERDRRPRLRLLARRQPRRAQPARPARGSAAPGPVRRQRPWPAGQGSRLPVRQRRGLRRIAHRLRDHRARRGGGDQRRPRSLRRRRRPRQHGRLPDDDALRHGVRPRSTPASARPRRPRCATASTTSRAPTPAPPAA